MTGMMISTGERLRELILAAHEGVTFTDYLCDLVRGAPTIPHGIEEMGWDSYLHDVGWDALTPHVLAHTTRNDSRLRPSPNL